MKSCISFVAVILITFIGISYVSYLTDRKYGDEKYYDFYEEKEAIDVLFFGSSHSLNAIMPMELWKK